jgi:signal transduction histidine kinase
MSRRQWAFDVLLAAVVLVLGQLEAWNGAGATHLQGPHVAESLAYGVGAVFLVLRRAHPLICLVGVTTAYLLEFAAVGSPEGFGVAIPPAVALYSVARWERRRPAWWGLAVGLVLGTGWIALDPVTADVGAKSLQVLWLLPWLIAWLVGALVRSQVQNSEQRRLRREEQATRAVAEERNRIARELHDVLGHSVSVMTVQASAVRRRLTPEQAAEREALESVEAVGREALTEMRRMVSVLRDAGDVADREPPPTLADVDRLVAKFRDAGLPVDITVTGEPRPLAPGLDLTAYRLLQEGLTNALRHAVSPTRTEVAIAYAPDALRLVVRDDGRPVPAGVQAGHGLLGMRERVAVYGGELLARPRAGGGFELVATLPVVTA